MTKSLVIVALLIVAIFGTVSALRKPSPSQATTIRWGVRIDNATVAPQIVTILNYAEKEANLRLELTEFSSSDDVASALATNQIDIGTMGVTEAFPLIAKGVPVKLIAQMSLSTNQLFVRNDGSIKTFADLKGKKIGGGLGGSSHMATRIALAAQGVDPDKDVQFVEVKKTLYGLALNQKKEVDAIMGGKQNSNNFEAGQTIDMQEWESLGYAELLQPKQSLIVRSDFLATNAKLVEKLLSAYQRSFLTIVEDKDAVAEQISTYVTEKSPALKISKKEVLEVFSYTVFQANIDEKGIQDLAHQSYRAGLVDADLTASQIVDNRFASILKQ